MDSPSVPQAPDPVATANAQGQANLDAARITAQLNRPDQITPFGSLHWSQGAPTSTFDEAGYQAALAKWQAAQARQPAAQPASEGDFGFVWRGADSFGGNNFTGTNSGPMPTRDQFTTTTPSDKWTSTMELSPEVKAIIDAQMKTSLGLSGAIDNALGRVNQMSSQPLDFSAGSLSADRKRVEDALYSSYTSRLDPRFQQDENTLRSDLMNRGLVEGSEAWNNQIDAFNRGKTDAYGQAQRDSVTAGGAEQNRQAQLMMAGRNQLINELASLRNGQQTQLPQFSGGASGAAVQPAPIAQSAYNSYQGNMNAYNAGVAGDNALMGGLFSLGSMALGAPSTSVIGRFLGA